MESKEEVIKRWSDTGLLDGISGKKDLAKLLEGEASYMLREDLDKTLKAENNTEPEVSDAVKEWLGRKPKTKRVEDKDHTYSGSTNIVWDITEDDITEDDITEDDIIGDNNIADDIDDILDGENDVYDGLFGSDTTSDLRLVADVEGIKLNNTLQTGRLMFKFDDDEPQQFATIFDYGSVDISLKQSENKSGLSQNTNIKFTSEDGKSFILYIEDID